MNEELEKRLSEYIGIDNKDNFDRKLLEYGIELPKLGIVPNFILDETIDYDIKNQEIFNKVIITNTYNIDKLLEAYKSIN